MLTSLGALRNKPKGVPGGDSSGRLASHSDQTVYAKNTGHFSAQSRPAMTHPRCEPGCGIAHKKTGRKKVFPAGPNIRIHRLTNVPRKTPRPAARRLLVNRATSGYGQQSCSHLLSNETNPLGASPAWHKNPRATGHHQGHVRPSTNCIVDRRGGRIKPALAAFGANHWSEVGDVLLH